MDLRPYQTAAIDGARAAIRQGKRKVLIVCPTGGGKTVIAAEVIRSAGAKGAKTLFLAHRRELIQQTCDKLGRFGVSHGIIQAGMPMSLHRPAQVASVQTLIRRPDALSRVDLIFVDEAHHVTTKNTYAKVLQLFPGAIVVGLTATPWRLDGNGLGDVFDAHVQASTPRELRDLGFLVPVGGWEYEGLDTTTARVKLGDFVQADLQTSAKSARVVGDIVSEWMLHAAGKRTILFATSVEHSQLMVEAFRKEGIPAEHIDGEMASTDRDRVLANLRSGQTLVVCNCNVLTEGFDCPELEVCILARPTLSTALYLQMVGRVLRPSSSSDKAMARIHDHAGCLAAHGHPYAERDYRPETSAGRSDRKKIENGGGAAQKRCTACQSVIAQWPCDACGYHPTPAELTRELFEQAAAKREITADGTAPKKPVESDEVRARKWKQRYEWDDDGYARREFYQRMVAKHGVSKGAWVYRWASGNSERPRTEWVEEVGAIQ